MAVLKVYTSDIFGLFVFQFLCYERISFNFKKVTNKISLTVFFESKYNVM